MIELCTCLPILLPVTLRIRGPRVPAFIVNWFISSRLAAATRRGTISPLKPPVKSLVIEAPVYVLHENGGQAYAVEDVEGAWSI